MLQYIRRAFMVVATGILLSVLLYMVGLFGLMVYLDSQGVLISNISTPKLIDLRFEDAIKFHKLNLEKYKSCIEVGNAVVGKTVRVSLAERYEIGRSITFYSKKNNLSQLLVMAIVAVESDGNPRAVSYKNAKGLMQLMDEWVSEGEDPFDIETNIRLGTRLLAANINERGLDWGIQSYYWGNATPSGSYLTKVNKALERING